MSLAVLHSCSEPAFIVCLLGGLHSSLMRSCDAVVRDCDLSHSICHVLPVSPYLSFRAVPTFRCEIVCTAWQRPHASIVLTTLLSQMGRLGAARASPKVHGGEQRAGSQPQEGHERTTASGRRQISISFDQEEALRLRPGRIVGER